MRAIDTGDQTLTICCPSAQERATPGTLLVYHTSAQGAKLADDPKQHEHSPLGRHGHLVQLNAAGRQVQASRTCHDPLQKCIRADGSM